MSDVRLIPVSIKVTYDVASNDQERYEKEFYQMGQADEDPIGQWLRMAKARGDTGNSDPVMLNLMVELYRKMDRLEQILTHTVHTHPPLPFEAEIEGIGFEHFKLKETRLEPGTTYYGRVDMPIHPKREIPVFFEAVDETLMKITHILDWNENEWASYLTAKERAMIRHMKGLE